MKTKITLELPTREKLLAGLTPRDVHPPFVRAENEAAITERTLEQRRASLADHERRVAEMPVRVQRGQVKASALADALRERDAAALLIPQAEQALASAQERVAVETKNAVVAVQRAAVERAAQLERVAAEWAPFLVELRELSTALALIANPLAVGGFTSISWPCDSACEADRRQKTMSSQSAPPLLHWSKP